MGIGGSRQLLDGIDRRVGEHVREGEIFSRLVDCLYTALIDGDTLERLEQRAESIRAALKSGLLVVEGVSVAISSRKRIRLRPLYRLYPNNHQ